MVLSNLSFLEYKTCFCHPPKIYSSPAIGLSLSKPDGLLISKDIEKTVEKIPNSNRKRQDCKPMLFEEWKPFITMRKAFVFDKLSKENIPPDGAQTEGDRIKNQPEDDLFCFYLGPTLSFGECDDNFSISEILGYVHFSTKRTFPSTEFYGFLSSGTNVNKSITCGGTARGAPLLVSTKTQSVSPRTNGCSSVTRRKR